MRKKKKEVEEEKHIDAEKYSAAGELIARNFPGSFTTTYLTGKTRFRDFLYQQMGCSLLEAEELVDVLEQKGRIQFARLAKGKRLGAWEVRPGEEESAGIRPGV